MEFLDRQPAKSIEDAREFIEKFTAIRDFFKKVKIGNCKY
jgi:hypothetical protein